MNNDLSVFNFTITSSHGTSLTLCWQVSNIGSRFRGLYALEPAISSIPHCKLNIQEIAI